MSSFGSCISGYVGGKFRGSCQSRRCFATSGNSSVSLAMGCINFGAICVDVAGCSRFW